MSIVKGFYAISELFVNALPLENRWLVNGKEMSVTGA
jgi:hypothetical protein